MQPESTPTVASQLLNMASALMIDGRSFYTEAYLKSYADKEKNNQRELYRSALDASAAKIRILEGELAQEKAKPATLVSKPVTKQTLEGMLTTVRRKAEAEGGVGSNILYAQIEFLKKIIYEFEGKLMSTPIPIMLKEKDEVIDKLKIEIDNRGKQIQYLSKDRDDKGKEFIDTVHRQREAIVKLEQELGEYRIANASNDDVEFRRMQEVNDLYGFVCDVAALKKIPEGSYISKEEATVLNAVITHAKGLYRKYD